MPDREYPAGALKAAAGPCWGEQCHSFPVGECCRVKYARESFDRIAAMSPEDRATLARWVWPEGRDGFGGSGRIPTEHDLRSLRAALDIEAATVKRITEWLRGDEGEKVRIGAVDAGVPPEDALAASIEREFGRSPMPSSEWPDEKAITAAAEELIEGPDGRPTAGEASERHAWAELALTAAAKASPVIPAPKSSPCPRCEGDSHLNTIDGPAPCPDCHGTGVAEVIPVAVLREWASDRQSAVDRTRGINAVGFEEEYKQGYERCLGDITALLDEHTRKEPTQA